MAKIQTFNFDSDQIRVIHDDKGNPWFVANDVCAILDIANSRDALSRLDDDEKGVVSTYTLGGEQQQSSINESGLYSLVLSSRKPEAKRFKKWVTSDVLPTLRKTGSYTMQVPQTLPEALRLAADLAEKNEAQALQLEQQRPAVEFVERYVEARSSKAISDVAKIIGAKPKAFFEWLHNEGVIFKRGGSWMPYSKYEHHFEVKTGEASGHAYTQSRFTPKGVEWVAGRWNSRKPAN